MDGVGRKTTTIPANPASVTATCAAMPRASLGCIATIKGEHGQEIKAQIHALEEELNQQLFDRFVSAGMRKPTPNVFGVLPRFSAVTSAFDDLELAAGTTSYGA